MKLRLLALLGVLVSGCASTPLALVDKAPEGCTSLGTVEVNTLCRPASGNTQNDIEMMVNCDEVVANRLKAAARARGANKLLTTGPGRGEAYSCSAK